MSNYQVVSSKQRLLLVKLEEEHATRDAIMIPFQSSTEWSIENSSESDTTKQGNVQSSGVSNETLSFEALVTRVINEASEDDPDLTRMLEYAVREGKKVFIWDVDFGAKPKDITDSEAKLYPSKFAPVQLTSATSSFGEGNGNMKYEATADFTVYHDATVSPLNNAIATEYFFDTIKGSPKVTTGLETYKPKTEKK
ncbi:hypothetical protein DOK76_12395 [Vagococcus sp. DIV0080]|uniref:Phage major tail protein, TP901-1 family n=1 Tax=Candidatus Vagococcus giribetii TaxID=2230876 RepID=A0ABS3HXK5_9ENTE|nr:phage tail tube protein [Vagococcus sp. DIV0080]MBO0477873.1 hypothetical protein [Vagococcus sp. DIV0080]